MYRYKRLLVGLNLTNLDSAVIQYADLISNLSKAEKVQYLFINRNSNIPESILNEFPELLQTLDEFAMQKMKRSVKENIDRELAINSAFEVIDGLPTEKILTHSLENDTDLIIVGRKKRPQATKRLPVKLARKAPCSVLVIPSNVKIESPRGKPRGIFSAALNQAAQALALDLYDVRYIS